MSCQHEQFVATVEVIRLVHDNQADSAQHFAADIKIACVDCGKPLGFKGVPCGVSLTEPMVSVDGLELRVPLMSPAEVELRGGLAGLSQQDGAES